MGGFVDRFLVDWLFFFVSILYNFFFFFFYLHYVGIISNFVHKCI